MRRRLEMLVEFLYIMLVCLPAGAIVITAVYVGFFIKDIYNLNKKLWQSFSRR
jgi:hypothetical protein